MTVPLTNAKIPYCTISGSASNNISYKNTSNTMISVLGFFCVSLTNYEYKLYMLID